MKTLKRNMTAQEIITTKLCSYICLPAILHYLGLDADVILILAILLVLDVVTGLLRVAVTEPQKLSSRIGIIGVLSKLLVILVPLLLGLAGKGIGYDLKPMIHVSLSVLVVYEVWSILGNIVQIRTKDVTLNEFDAVSALIRGLQEMFKRMLGTLVAQVPAKGEEIIKKD